VKLIVEQSIDIEQTELYKEKWRYFRWQGRQRMYFWSQDFRDPLHQAKEGRRKSGGREERVTKELRNQKKKKKKCNA
jgi:hypothetical protein